MANIKTVNYTPEQTLEIVNLYVNDGATPEALASKFSRTVRSIVAKLSREGVYRSKTREAGTARVKKSEMIAAMEAVFGLEAGDLESLEKASWKAIKHVHSKVC